MAVHVVQGVLTIALVFPFCGKARHLALRQRWSRRLLAILGIRLQAEGTPVAPGCLLVANHISWVDIFVINALAPSAFVSKAEVRAWPVAGWLAAKSDTVFLRRGSRGHAKIVNAEIAALLGAGRNVAVFPEGTTTDGSQVLHFHAALLQPAIAAGRPVQPLALSYHTPDGVRSRAPAYDGDVSFGECFSAIVGERALIARLQAAEPVATDPHTTDRRELAQRTREHVATLNAAELPAPAAAQPATCHTSPSSSRSAVSLPPHTQPESSAISPLSR
ncbi:lysophospholipid acyltransferase family protein [Pseudothauera rhizosphaerae]|uniref:1-acyl-sn-glycerol-3-phosphate acyltransferase n=1 Tax=Pseudothauera rhizosphaerae TaxID=2565932 RepID=A0A4S4AT62_9RHOO|nr:lysophospholipid acyltransferase family protein [Pseudothauera rhizosphaerae]THF61749.1 1-acyl-sn-glycerol-3-phosphate acyltransferase [Pseudothauera rhizosphaerae]